MLAFFTANVDDVGIDLCLQHMGPEYKEWAMRKKMHALEIMFERFAKQL
jgi:hypothetical protein